MSDEVKNPYALFEDKADPLVPTATLQVYDFINEYLQRIESTHINRASSATLCFKRRWFQKKGYDGVPLTPRKLVNFLLGDLAEKTMQYFVLKGCVGPGRLYSEVNFGEPIGKIIHQEKELILYKQEDLEADIAGFRVTAHVDGWGKRNSDGRWELIEFKSAASYGFKEFKEIGPKDYLKQAHVNLSTTKAKALGARDVRFFYLRKETGHMWDRVHSFDEELFKDICEEFKLANQKREPKAPYLLKKDKSGRLIAAFPCTYCPYIQHCLGEYQVEWKKDQFGNLSPVYVFNKGDK